MNILYGVVSQSGVPSDEKTVRATTANIDHGAPPAVMDDAPVTGRVETDSDSTLPGLATRQLASEWFEGQQYAPSWAGNVDAQALNSDRINGQVSSSGTAAAREAAGQFGHGTASYAVGIEPVQALVDGGRMDNNYFGVPKPNIQGTSGAYMTTPPGVDRDTTGLVSDTAKAQARYANAASLYSTWYGSDR